jgi:hypothetical protein
MAKPQKTGKAAPDRRTNPYTVRYNDAENRDVLEAARAKALEVASWIRMVSVEAARAQKVSAETGERLSDQPSRPGLPGRR